jgi:hypothetical protein
MRKKPVKAGSRDFGLAVRETTSKAPPIAIWSSIIAPILVRLLTSQDLAPTLVAVGLVIASWLFAVGRHAYRQPAEREKATRAEATQQKFEAQRQARGNDKKLREALGALATAEAATKSAEDARKTEEDAKNAEKARADAAQAALERANKEKAEVVTPTRMADVKAGLVTLAMSGRMAAAQLKEPNLPSNAPNPSDRGGIDHWWMNVRQYMLLNLRASSEAHVLNEVTKKDLSVDISKVSSRTAFEMQADAVEIAANSLKEGDVLPRQRTFDEAMAEMQRRTDALMRRHRRPPPPPRTRTDYKR